MGKPLGTAFNGKDIIVLFKSELIGVRGNTAAMHNSGLRCVSVIGKLVTIFLTINV